MVAAAISGVIVVVLIAVLITWLIRRSQKKPSEQNL